MKTEKPASAKLWYGTASNWRSDSMVMEAHIGDDYFASVYYEDNKWQVDISLPVLKSVQLDWEDFADLFYHFSVFMAGETPAMVSIKQNHLDNVLEELEALREEKKKGLSASEEK